MPDDVKRSYRSVQRAGQAATTRAAVLRAAHKHFTTVGYAATGVADVAASAGVNLDTVYRAVGRKPELMLAVIDMTLAGSDQPLAAEQRDYVQGVLAAKGARRKLTTYADALGRLMPKVAPLFDALAQAALTEPECAAVLDSIAHRRRSNMGKLADDLRSTGELRDDLDNDEVADLLWMTNAPEYYALAVARGWSPATYSERLADVWTRVLIARDRSA